MTNAKSLALVVVSLGGTVTGRTNAGLLADIVRALGGTPTGNTNADLIGQIAAALGGEAGEGTNADRLKAVADALDVDASGTNAEVLAAILTGLGGSPEAGDTNATLIMGISEHPPGPGPTPTPKYTVRFHVATDSVGYGSVSPASASDVEEGSTLSASGQAVLIGGVSRCTATPEEDTQEYDYAFVKWTGADDGSTAVPETVTGNLDLYAHFSRTPVTPPVETFTAYFHVATDSTGYGSVSVASVADVPAGTSVTVAQTVAVGAVGSCSATPEEDTQEWDYAFVGWTGADDASTPAATTINADTHYYAHFSRTAVGPQPMDPSLFTFTVADGEATVTGWAGTPPADGYDLVFPETDGQGHPVTTIGSQPQNNGAWAGAASVTSATVTELKGSAFYNGRMESVSFPAVTNIESQVFGECASLASVSLPAATSLGAWAFRFAALPDVTLPAATSIANAAFQSCTSLASVSLPAATSIADAAFQSCTSLASVSLPSATTIGAWGFYGCTGIESVTFGPLSTVDTSSNTSFPDWTFYDTDGTTILDKTVAANLANSTFVGTASALVKQ